MQMQRAVAHHQQRQCRQRCHQQQHGRPNRLRLRPAAAAYTEPALAAIRASHQQAARQGSLFVAPPHLLLGLLDVPGGCEAAALLAQGGLSAAAAEAALVDPELLTTSRSMGAGDLHWAPDSRAALETAAAAAQEQGLAAAGTPHLLLGVVSCGNAAVDKLLQQSGMELDVFAGSVREAASSCKEAAAPAQPPSGAAAAAALIHQYNQHVATNGTAPSPLSAAAAAGLGGGASGASSSSTRNTPAPQFDPSVLVRTPEDDDIYE